MSFHVRGLNQSESLRFFCRRGLALTDVLYMRGWDDCLEAVIVILSKSKDAVDFKKRLEQVQISVKENKFEKIKYELGLYQLFNP